MKIFLSTTALALTLAFSGMAYANENEHGKGDHKGPPFMEEALSQLPEKDAAQFRETMKQSHEKDKALFDQMHKLHEDIHDLMTEEKFDKGAYIAKSEELQKLHDKIHTDMTKAFAKAIGQLSQDERSTLADAMQKEHRKHHHNDSGKSGEDKDSSDSSGQ